MARKEKEEMGRESGAQDPARGQVSAAALQKALEGIRYPARKKDLISTAEKNNAPSLIIDTIRELPDKEYRSPPDVSKEFGRR